MKWFNGIHTLEELTKKYRQLARQHHPDLGGDEKLMKEINAERDEVQKAILHDQIFDEKSTSQFFELEELLLIAKIRHYKIGWVAIQALKFAKSYEDCLQIARSCHYKDGWAWYKWKEIEHRYK